MANKEMVKKFLLQHEYLWDCKVMNNDCNFVEAIDSPNGKQVGDFTGKMLIVKLISLEGEKNCGMEVSLTDFKLYDIETNDDPYRPEDVFYLKEDFKFSWLKFVLDNYGTYDLCNRIWGYCYDEIKNIKEDYAYKIASLKEEIKSLEKEMKDTCEAYEELYSLAIKKVEGQKNTRR